MMTFAEAVTYLLSGGAGWLMLLWLGIAVVFSVMLNHQDLATKRLNTVKAFGFGFFWTAIAVTSVVANGDAYRLPLSIVLSLGAILIVVSADWLGYLLRRMAFHRGGVQGWAWESLAGLFAQLHKLAEERYQESSSPKYEHAILPKKPARRKAKKIVPMMTLLLLLIVGCQTDYVTATPTAGPSPTLDSSPGATSPAPTITVPTLTPTASPTITATPEPGNRIQCYGFECGDALQKDPWGNPDGDLRVAHTWKVGWADKVPAKYANPNGAHDCRTFKPHAERETHGTHVRDGFYSQRLVQAYSACAGWLQQTAQITPGAHYVASAFVLNWSTDRPQVDTPSTSDMAAWICIDPNGGDKPFAEGVVCGDQHWNSREREENRRDEFGYVEVEATGESSLMTVFLVCLPNWAVSRSDCFWEDVSLMLAVDDVGGGDPQTVATSTPAIIEQPSTPTPAEEDALGVMIFRALTNVRNCETALLGKPGWPVGFDVVGSCPAIKAEGAVSQLGKPDDGPALVHRWAADRGGNTWACFEDGCWITAVACYNGSGRGDFYPGVGTWNYFRLLNAKELPVAVNPCEARRGS